MAKRSNRMVGLEVRQYLLTHGSTETAQNLRKGAIHMPGSVKKSPSVNPRRDRYHRDRRRPWWESVRGLNLV